MPIIDKINKRFDEKIVLDNFSISFSEKGVVCLFGPSGSGKTTLLNIISGLEKSDSGEISGFRDKRLSFMFQEDRLIPWITVIDNVKLVMDKDNAKNQSALDFLNMVGLKDEALNYPSELSGGMCRRVALARTLAYGGDVYLLDEPFKGLDNALKEQLIDKVSKLGEKALVIIVTHDMEEAKLVSDEIYIQSGPPLETIEKICI